MITRYSSSLCTDEHVRLYILNLDTLTYTTSVLKSDYITNNGGGTFHNEPDQLLSHGNYIYFTEDGGSTVGVYAIHITT